jgi:hypothetical protein
MLCKVNDPSHRISKNTYRRVGKSSHSAKNPQDVVGFSKHEQIGEVSNRRVDGGVLVLDVSDNVGGGSFGGYGKGGVINPREVASGWCE